MLSIIDYGKDEYDFPALIVLGCFDAIHIGHRDLLKKAKLQAKINGLDLGVMMFRDGKSGKLLYSFEERCSILEQFNVKFILAVDFNDDFKAITPVDFLHTVEDKINVKAYMSGKDFRFGAQAKGKSSTLKNYAEDEENGVWYMPVKDVALNGEKVSTTLIKGCLEEGNIAKANELLGAEFSLSGEVVKGAGRGTSVVGFPTVNIFYPEWKHDIKHGVYSVKCQIDGTDYTGIANYGNCPTFGDERVALEVYFEGFSGDLYGRTLTVRFIEYIRDIEEFGSAAELTEQLQTDLQTVSEEIVVADDGFDEPVSEEAVSEQPAESEEVVIEEQPAESEEVVVEEQPAESEQAVVEEQPAESEEAIVEEQPAESEEAVVEEQPAESEQVVVEEQPAENEEVVAEEQPAESEAVVAEEQPAESEEAVVEEQPAESEKVVIEEQPAEIEEVVVEEQPAESEEVVVEEQPDTEDTNTDNGEQGVD